jgi:hypothetical protein
VGKTAALWVPHLSPHTEDVDARCQSICLHSLQGCCFAALFLGPLSVPTHRGCGRMSRHLPPFVASLLFCRSLSGSPVSPHTQRLWTHVKAPVSQLILQDQQDELQNIAALLDCYAIASLHFLYGYVSPSFCVNSVLSMWTPLLWVEQGGRAANHGSIPWIA